jgi:hypothetical protein
MRIVRHSISVGPSPSRARSTAVCAAAKTASTSLPSTATPGNPYAWARSTGSTANSSSFGVEYANWLF